MTTSGSSSRLRARADARTYEAMSNSVSVICFPGWKSDMEYARVMAQRADHPGLLVDAIVTRNAARQHSDMLVS
jgi:hypothetical protein